MPGNPMEGARKKGREAAEKGEPKTANPYAGKPKAGGFANAWDEGYDSVKK